MKVRAALLLGILFPLLLFGARKEKTNWEKYWQEGMDLYKQGRYADAIPQFEAVVRLLPDRSSGHSMVGKCRYNLEDYAGALVHFQEARRLSPEDGDAAYRLAATHLALKQYAQVLEIVRGFEPSRVPVETRGDYLRAAGLAAFAQRDYRGAAAYFADALAASRPGAAPSDLRAWHVKALIQQARLEKGEAQAGTYARAFPEAEALAAAEASPETLLLAAEAALGSGRYGEAESLARDVLRIVPGDPFGALYLGQALCGQERFREALTPLEQAAERPLPEDGRKAALNQLGYAWERLGDRGQALKIYTQAGNEEKMRKLSEPAVP